MRRASSQLVTTILILVVSLSASVAVTWLAPSLTAASVNMLFRFRGRLAPPGDIVIVAIDDASLQRVGNWPWPRSVMASALERIGSASPRAVGLDVVYAESSDPTDDRLLAEAIKHQGRVVLPAQLTEIETAAADTSGAQTWLAPLPSMRAAAAATGHAHADPDVDGVLRTVQLSKADAKGERLWAFGLETLKVAEQIPAGSIEELPGALRVGQYEIAVQDEALKSAIPGVTIIRPNEMVINYLGPPGTFPYYSIADILDGKIPASAFAGKIVLIGAVAQTMGDTRITPFIHYGDFERQGGTGMPGIEVHANIIETIRRGVWLNSRPDWHGLVVALLVILCAAVFVRALDGWRALASLSLLFALIIAGSLYVFNRYFIIPPVVPMLTGFFTVVPLLLLGGSMTASRDLDMKLDRLARIQQRFMSRRAQKDSLSVPLAFLGSILRAETVALFQKSSRGRTLQLTTHFGRKPDETEELSTMDAAETIPEDSSRSLRMPLIDEAELRGTLLVVRRAGEPFSESERQLAREFAESMAVELRASGSDSQKRGRSFPVGLPRNLTWKLRAVDDITANLMARISFMNQAFNSMTDGLLVADITGRVVFANPSARPFWPDTETGALAGKSLTELFVERGIIDIDGLRATMREVLAGRSLQMDVERPGPESRFYTLQFSAVVASVNQPDAQQPQPDDAQPVALAHPRVIGLIVIIDDVTKRRELEHVKAETMQLVSHELRTPLTSIRSLSELLLKYPVPEDASPEILETIHSESVRLSDLINRYLDVTRIESGTQSLVRQPVAVNSLLSECVRLLGGLAAQKGIRITLKTEEPPPTLFGDAQLLTQAVNNLLGNAIKYSPAGTEVEIGTTVDDARASIYVRDNGHGIPEEFQGRVFEKFYRLERDARSETIGTGLGLPLVKEIVERHGGHVTLESDDGKGSTFTIHLPLQRA